MSAMGSSTPPSILNDITGPAMRGPSSSHTAGSYHIGVLARALLGARPFAARFTFDVGGSYAQGGGRGRQPTRRPSRSRTQWGRCATSSRAWWKSPVTRRNAAAAASAFVCADLVLGGYVNPIPLDETVDAVYAVGRMMPSALRCTSRGGLAVTPAALALKRIED